MVPCHLWIRSLYCLLHFFFRRNLSISEFALPVALLGSVHFRFAFPLCLFRCFFLVSFCVLLRTGHHFRSCHKFLDLPGNCFMSGILCAAGIAGFFLKIFPFIPSIKFLNRIFCFNSLFRINSLPVFCLEYLV